MEYNVLDYGTIPDDPSASAVNAATIKQVIALAAISARPGPVVVPFTQSGIYVDCGVLQLNTPGAVLYGYSGMGAGLRTSMASALIGVGPGDLLTITGTGVTVKNLSLHQDKFGVQGGKDALIKIAGERVTQITLKDLYLGTPHIGISIDIPADYLGEFWLEDIQIQGQIGYAATVINAGNATVHLRHVISSADISDGKPQPQWGHKVLSCGEFIMEAGCDTICCGNCLALVPGHDGAVGQYVNGVFVSNSLLDSGNGQACLLIWPQLQGYCTTLGFESLWCSSPGNFNETVTTNGIYLDGSASTPLYEMPIQDVKFIGCKSKSFRGNMGLYAKSVDALSIHASTFGDCLDGIHIAPGCSDLLIQNNHSGRYVPATHAPNANNMRAGIFIEPTEEAFVITGNMLSGNNGGGIISQNRPRKNQLLAFNLD